MGKPRNSRKRCSDDWDMIIWFSVQKTCEDSMWMKTRRGRECV